MQIARAKTGARADINVTPLIDIVLVLLIIFMVLTPAFLKHMTATIPKPAPAAPDVIAHLPLVLEYFPTRRIVLNGEAVSFEDLAGAVADRLRFDRHKVVFFQIADECGYGDVIKLMDTVRGAGARTLGIVTGAVALR